MTAKTARRVFFQLALDFWRNVAAASGDLADGGDKFGILCVLQDGTDRAAFEAAQWAEQDRLRSLYASRQQQEEPAAAPVDFARDTYLRPEDYDFSDLKPGEIALPDLLPYFDDRVLRMAWGLKGNDAPELVAEARTLLARCVARRELAVRYSIRFFQARREGDTLLLDSGDRLPMLRQESAPGRSLADFAPASGTGPPPDWPACPCWPCSPC